MRGETVAVAVYRRTTRQRFSLVIVTLLSVTIITLDQRGQTAEVIDVLRSEVRDVLVPLQSATDAVLSPVGDFIGGVINYGSLKAENARLREQLAEARAREAEATHTERELNLLRELANLPFAADIPAVSARVVAGTRSNFDLIVEIDKGRASGVAKGMPVVAGGGLVGRVVESSRSRAAILLLTDPTFSVGVRAGETGDLGVAQGEGRERSPRVDLISLATKLRVGDVVTTSGLSESPFPPGIPVGRVAAVNSKAGSLQKSVRLKPLADLQRLELVKVLQYSPRGLSP